MNSIVEFFTAEAGVFAAVVAVIGLLGAIVALLRPYFESRRKSSEDVGRLEIAALHISDLAEWSTAREMRFTLSNAGNRQAILVSLRLCVESSSPSRTIHRTRTAAPVAVYQHRVELSPEGSSFDIRGRSFSDQIKPLNFEKGETMAFVVKLVSPASYVYHMRVEAAWYDVGEPQAIRQSYTEYVDIDFPQSAPR
ncbi:hypothetical protein OHS70_34060 [Streptomyces sp. NBC_00390]|uniref:hypothetical protein n=1 Tax=Streptomyces sp. NBC_00390 TaxID=2975736 RepID=UPI002E1D959B